MTGAADPPFGRTRIWYPVVGSTMEIAASLATRGAPHGTVVEAGYQTSGRGRQGRHWVAPPGSALLASWVMRPAAGADIAALSPLVALALLRAVASIDAAIPVRYKWPNDVWIEGRKLAGILLTARPGVAGPVVIAGTGINVRRPADPPERSARPSDWIEAPQSAMVRAALAEALDAIWVAYREEGALPEAARAELERALLWRGEWVELRDAAGPVRGTIAGVASDGALLLRQDGGDAVPIRTGEIARGPRILPRTGQNGAVYFPEQETG